MSENLITGSGIQIQSYTDILNGIIYGTPQVPGLVQIYGADINTASNTPDGNLINIFTLSKEDILQLCVSIYDSFDPDQAVGIALDNISQLCGIARKGGSYTHTNIVLTTTQAVNINGLDNTISTPFTISDANGNEFYLTTTQTIGSSGSGIYDFTSAKVGYIQVIPNTITNIVTITSGVALVNNPSAPTLVGEDQETDALFRVRRQHSVSIPAQGAFYGLSAGLSTIFGLNQAVVYENKTTSTDAKNVPAKSIWVITDGGSGTDIGNMIYKYLNLGCGMYGTSSISLPQAYGTNFIAYYSTAQYQNFYATMHLTSKGGLSINTTDIANILSANYILGIYQAADITSISSLLHIYSSDLIIGNLGVSLSNGSWGSSVLPSAFTNKLVLPVANIKFS